MDSGFLALDSGSLASNTGSLALHFEFLDMDAGFLALDFAHADQINKDKRQPMAYRKRRTSKHDKQDEKTFSFNPIRFKIVLICSLSCLGPC